MMMMMMILSVFTLLMLTCFVLFDFGYVAIRAIELKNHSTLNGKVIRVMWSRRDPDARKSSIGNVFVKVSTIL
jgi:uncharacterized protein YneF (UPF0154 family)